MNLNNLQKKGWRPHEITKTNYLLKYAKQKRSRLVRTFDKTMFWIVLLITIIENVILPLALIPLILATKPWLYLSVAAILAYIFGYFFIFLLKDLDLKHHHHIVAVVSITVIAALNVYLSTTFANYLIETIPFQIPPANPFFTIPVFVVAFFLPYIILLLKK